MRKKKVKSKEGVQSKEVALSIGGLALKKGEIREVHALFAWDAVQFCSGSRCKIGHRCSFIDVAQKCAVQVQYLEALFLSIKSTYKYLNDVELFQIGMQLVPLYSHLLRLKIIEMGIGTDEIVAVTAKGRFVHPIYREVRQTIQAISAVWKNIGCGTPDVKPPSDDDIPLDDPRLIEGDPNYYDKLIKNASNKPLRKKGEIVIR